MFSKSEVKFALFVCFVYLVVSTFPVLRRDTPDERYLIAETKGYDPLEDVKKAAAERWCAAVNSEGSYGKWAFRLAKKPTEVSGLLSAVVCR